MYFVHISDAIIEIVDSNVDPEAVVETPDKFYNPGSHISLKCIIRKQKETNGKDVEKLNELFRIQNMIQTR